MAAFFEYYAQNGVLQETDLQAFREACESPLPQGFRIVRTHSLGQFALRELEKFQNIGLEALPFVPNGFQLNTSRHEIRKDENFKALKKFLVETEGIGAVCRQEVVSMIPPLYLQVQPESRVLDMCAAPGSKTCQMLEEMMATGGCRGVVVANELNWKRANLLIHQTQRLSSPALSVVQNDAKFLASAQLFDKILCDVPCTGDGTLRKSPEILKNYRPDSAKNLHKIQCNILLRGLHLLDDSPDNRLVYSTCSLNPLENEAVVAYALAAHPGEFELVEPSFPGLHSRPGLTHWRVPGVEGQFLESSTAESLRYFPPQDPSILEVLPKCHRFLPQMMNTGGFFVTAFRRIRKAGGSTLCLNPIKPVMEFEVLTAEKAETLNIFQFYGMTFEQIPGKFLTLKGFDPKKIFYVTDSLFEFLGSRLKNPPKALYAGVRVFEKLYDKYECVPICNWRVVQDGILPMLPYITKRKVGLNRDNFGRLLKDREIPGELVTGGLEHLDHGACLVYLEDYPQMVVTGVLNHQMLTLYTEKKVSNAFSFLLARMTEAAQSGA